ncbi:MAG: DnaJ C-terminal domain-containing protein [Bdellovibrionota bacterium]
MSAEQKDPYQILGVKSDAPQGEIKSAYRRLAKELHPDLNPGNKKAEERFKDIASAYELIGTEEARRKYESQKAEQEAMFENARRSSGGRPFYYQTQQGSPGGRYSQSFDAGDFDADLFENLFRHAGRGHRAPEPESETYSVEIELKDSIHGAEREFTLPSGKRLSVKIPAGIPSGGKLRFAGAAAGGGDVFFEIRIRPSSEFRIEGDDLISELSVSVEDAILGSEVRAATVDGPIALKIPPHVDTGRRIRVPGKGLFNRATKKRGNQIFVVSIHLPAVITPELEAAARQLKESRSVA